MLFLCGGVRTVPTQAHTHAEGTIVKIVSHESLMQLLSLSLSSLSPVASCLPFSLLTAYKEDRA